MSHNTPEPDALVKTKSADGVRQMFHEISPTYDFLNHLLSFNTDKRWRNFTARKTIHAGVHRILDVCSGTGDLAIALGARAGKLGIQPEIISTDFTPAMTRIAARKFEVYHGNRKIPQLPHVAVGDTMALPFPDSSFDLVTVAFGIRNVTNLRGGIADMVRVCRPGGRIAILEFSHPRNPLFRAIYQAYFFTILPRIGRMITGTKAYLYLPKSVSKFPDTAEFSKLLREIAGGEVTAHRLTLGIATLYIAEVK